MASLAGIDTRVILPAFFFELRPYAINREVWRQASRRLTYLAEYNVQKLGVLCVGAFPLRRKRIITMLRRSRTVLTVPSIPRVPARPQKPPSEVAHLPGLDRVKRLLGKLHLPKLTYDWPR